MMHYYVAIENKPMIGLCIISLHWSDKKKTRIKPTLNNCFPQSDDISKNVMCKIGIEIGFPFRY